jgi:hypothetical protein
MRMKTIQAVHGAAHWIQGLLDVRLPMDVIYGLRTR